MVLGFKPQFVSPVLEGSKLHSIRRDKKRRWRAGMRTQMATGVRTKNYSVFKETTCVSVQRVYMTYDHMLHVSIDGRELDLPEKMRLAKNDGFTEYKDFVEWFHKLIEEGGEDAFCGRLIHWTDLRY